MRAYDFKEELDKGKETEKIVKKFYENKGYTVRDVSSDEKFQEKDIDLIVYDFKNDESFFVEVKSDNTDTENYFAEVIANEKKCTLGCWLQTKSNYIAYYFVNKKELHIIKSREAKRYVLMNFNKLKTVRAYTKHNGKITYNSVGKLVNKKDLQEKMNIEIYDLKELI